MDMYKNAVWNELKNTMQKEWDPMMDLLANPHTAHLVTKEKLDRTRYKINGLLSQLDNIEQRVA